MDYSRRNFCRNALYGIVGTGLLTQANNESYASNPLKKAKDWLDKKARQIDPKPVSKHRLEDLSEKVRKGSKISSHGLEETFKHAREHFGNIPVGASLEIDNFEIINAGPVIYVEVEGKLGVWSKYHDHRGDGEIPFKYKGVY